MDLAGSELVYVLDVEKLLLQVVYELDYLYSAKTKGMQLRRSGGLDALRVGG